MILKMEPMDFRPDGSPRDAQLYGAVQEYAKIQFGEELVFPYYAHVHALLADNGDGKPYVMGLLGVRNAIDVCMFHVTPPSLDKKGMKIAEAGRELMFQRGHDYLADLGNTGQTVMVYVAAEAQRYWRRFLARVKAKPANRFEVKI